MTRSGTIARFLKALLPGRIDQLQELAVNAGRLEEHFTGLSDGALKAEARNLRQGQKSGPLSKDTQARALAIGREAVRRALGLRAYDTQLMGGLALHQGKIIEMATGEGKTLVAILAAYLNHLAGETTHIAVPNPYLACRDQEWTLPAFQCLGMTSGLIVSEQLRRQKREAYHCDVVYGTFSEFGFDFLRDNSEKSLANMMQRDHQAVIIDEADSILIDEGRTPLIISVSVRPETGLYRTVDRAITALSPADVQFDIKKKWVSLEPSGIDKLEQVLSAKGAMASGTSLYASENVLLAQLVTQALRAHHVFQRNVDYIVEDSTITLIDQRSGRKLTSRRYSDGLHPALETKEGIEVTSEGRTVSSISIQNYFKLYSKISGMSGTVMTDSEELQQVYNTPTLRLPTNRPVKRIDRPDHVLATAAEKHALLLDIIVREHGRGRPILVGTTTIEQSEMISRLLEQKGLAHRLLNANQTAYEAQIIAEAGKAGAISIATNMAGRGTDIRLGGQSASLAEAEHIRSLGGLLIIGTEKSDCKRVDNQLRGRSGRQGDAGESIFLLSLEDAFLKNREEGPASSKEKVLADPEKEMDRRRRLFESIQNSLEADHFRARLNLLKLDSVLNEQRKIIFAERRSVLSSTDLAATAEELRAKFIRQLAEAHCASPEPLEWSLAQLVEEFRTGFSLDEAADQILPLLEKCSTAEDAARKLVDWLQPRLLKRYAVYASESLDVMYRVVLLEVIDELWQQHFAQLDLLMSTVVYRSLGKRDPVVEFRTDAFELFSTMLDAIPSKFCAAFYKPQPKSQTAQNAVLNDLLNARN